MNDPTTDLASGLADKADKVIAKAIDNTIGKWWSLGELTGRVERIRCYSDTYETIFIDRKSVIELHDPEVTTKNDGTSIIMVAEQKYRTFGGEE